MILDHGFGDSESGDYRKPAGGLGANRGTVYTVCGCSGEGGLGDFPLHPAMAVNHGGFGSMIIEINNLQLKARFLRPSGAIDDAFAIDKSGAASIQPRLQITRGTSNAILSWPTSNPAFELQTSEPVSQLRWQAVSGSLTTNGRRNEIALPANFSSRLFRLRTPCE